MKILGHQEGACEFCFFSRSVFSERGIAGCPLRELTINKYQQKVPHSYNVLVQDIYHECHERAEQNSYCPAGENPVVYYFISDNSNSKNQPNPECPAYDTKEKVWRRLSFFQHKAFLHCRVPRVGCGGCGIHQIEIPWAREYSGFTLLMDAMIVTMAQSMQISEIASLASSSFMHTLSDPFSCLSWSITSRSCLMIASLSTALLEDYYSNNIEVLWSRMGFRSIWKNSGMGGYVGELNTY